MTTRDHPTGMACPRCGQLHQTRRLRGGERASCARCGASLRQPSRFGPHTLPALTATALVLAIPAASLPLVTLDKFGNEHAAHLGSGVEGLTRGGLPHLAALVSACAIAAPVLLAACLAAWWWCTEVTPCPRIAQRLSRTLEFVAHWSMPEVYVLGVLIAFVKLGAIVHVVARSGLWCLAAMSVVLLAAWRTFLLHDQPDEQTSISRNHA